jgi:transposase
MLIDSATLPQLIAALTALLVASDARVNRAETRALDLDGQIAHLKLTIAKMQRDTHGASSEKGARLLDQLEMQLGELVEASSAGKTAMAVEAPISASSTADVTQKTARRALPSHLPRLIQHASVDCHRSRFRSRTAI